MNINAVTLQLVKTNPETPLAIPDQPWWMSVVMVSIVVGWLFLSTRNQNE